MTATNADRIALLQEYVAASQSTPVIWGVSDCTAFAAGWVEKATGISIPRLATYSSKQEAHAIIERMGGLDNIWSEALGKVGVCERYSSPQVGDVAILETMRFGCVGVIVAQDQIAILRTDTGTIFLRPRQFMKIWAIS